METLSLTQASNFLHMSEGKLGELARTGKIKAAKPGKRWVFLKSDLVSYLDCLYSVLGNVSQQVGYKEKSLCQSLSAEVRGGLASQRQAEKEYAALLGLKKKS